MSAHWPVISARPGSEVRTVSPVALLRSVISGRSAVRRAAVASPRSSGAGSEWSPTFGASWQVPQKPSITGFPVASLSPATPVIRIGLESKTRSPRAIASRAASRPRPATSQGPKRVKTSGVNPAPLGSPPSGSLMPRKNLCRESATGAALRGGARGGRARPAPCRGGGRSALRVRPAIHVGIQAVLHEHLELARLLPRVPEVGVHRVRRPGRRRDAARRRPDRVLEALDQARQLVREAGRARAARAEPHVAGRDRVAVDRHAVPAGGKPDMQRDEAGLAV